MTIPPDDSNVPQPADQPGQVPPPPPPPPAPTPYVATPGAAATAGVTNKKATWSLVTGILSLVCCGVAFGIVAVVLGYQARNEIKTSGEGGDGLALGGMICGAIGLVLSIVWIPIYASRFSA